MPFGTGYGTRWISERMVEEIMRDRQNQERERRNPPTRTPPWGGPPGATTQPVRPGVRSWLAERIAPSRREHMGRSAWEKWVESQRFRGRVNAPVIQKDKRKSLLAKYPGGRPGGATTQPVKKEDPRTVMYVPPNKSPGGT